MGNHPNDFDDHWGGVHIREAMAKVKKVLKTVNGVRLPADQELPKQCPTHDCDWWPVTTSTGVYMHCPLCYNQPLVDALEDVLSRLADIDTIEALKADKGYGYRPYPWDIGKTPTDADLMRWHNALALVKERVAP